MARRPYTTPRALGPAQVDLARALRLAADLEDNTRARRLTESRCLVVNANVLHYAVERATLITRSAFLA